ncbi:MAG: hypothetical protein RIR09_2317, partial [Pseudomonadota bacterium]
CRLSAHCGLKGALSQAMQAYFAVLDGITLADLVAPRSVAVASPRSRRVQAVPGLPMLPG